MQVCDPLALLHVWAVISTHRAGKRLLTMQVAPQTPHSGGLMFRQLESFKLSKNLMPFWKSLAQLDVLIDGATPGLMNWISSSSSSSTIAFGRWHRRTRRRITFTNSMPVTPTLLAETGRREITTFVTSRWQPAPARCAFARCCTSQPGERP
jgi:hypothetical protein